MIHIAPRLAVGCRRKYPIVTKPKLGRGAVFNPTAKPYFRSFKHHCLKNDHHHRGFHLLTSWHGHLAVPSCGAKFGWNISVRLTNSHSIQHVPCPYARTRYMQACPSAPVAHSYMNPVPLFGSFVYVSERWEGTVRAGVRFSKLVARGLCKTSTPSWPHSLHRELWCWRQPTCLRHPST